MVHQDHCVTGLCVRFERLDYGSVTRIVKNNFKDTLSIVSFEAVQLIFRLIRLQCLNVLNLLRERLFARPNTKFFNPV